MFFIKSSLEEINPWKNIKMLHTNIMGDIFVAPYIENSEVICDYDSVINRVAEKTKELGGNAFKITDLKTPSIDNPCYRVSALALNSNE